MQITSDIELSGAGCTTAITPNQLVQSSSENDKIRRLWEQLAHASEYLERVLPTIKDLKVREDIKIAVQQLQPNRPLWVPSPPIAIFKASKPSARKLKK